MRLAEREILRAALAWWESKRPTGWSERGHLSTPTVNTATDAERRLALAVAAREERDMAEEGRK